MPEHCTYCGCLLKYRAWRRQETLATREQRQALTAAARAADDWSLYGEGLASYGTREVWGIAYRCPGCAMTGSRYSPEYPQAEAEALVAEQNRHARTRAAARAARDWKEEVRRRAVWEARIFADLLLARFPQWEPFLEFLSPALPSDAELPPYWDRALRVRVPSENPAVPEPLQVEVSCGEVLPSWVHSWHTHLNRSGPDAKNIRHLEQGLEVVEWVVTEQVVIWTAFLDGRLTAGGGTRVGQDLPTLGRPEAHRETIEVRSWRGTYDRILEPARDA